MWQTFTLLVKFLSASVDCLGAHETWHEEDSAAVQVEPVAGGEIVTFELKAKLWASFGTGQCIADALKEAGSK